MNFPKLSDDEYIKFFSDIWDHGTKDSTFKFAFGRFLVEYCKQQNPDLHVSFATIAEYFLKYFWPQVCRSNLKHNGHGDTMPVIVTCIKKHFTKLPYTQNYNDIEKKYPEKIKTCVEELSKPSSNLNCFKNVTYAFQRLDDFGNGKFFWYNETGKIEKPGHKPVPKFDLTYGIDINPKAATFFQKYNRILEKVIILEWAKFLEKFNNTPKLIEKTEGDEIKRKANDFTKILEDADFKTCFYNESHNLIEGETHADHVIPFSYMREDEIWNHVLSCAKCNLAKSAYLPPKKFIDRLIDRNTDESKFLLRINTHSDKTRKRYQKIVKNSLGKLGDDPKKMILKYYADALSDGFILFKGSFD